MVGVPEKVVLVHDGKEIEARFTTNALCAVEAAFQGQSLEQVGVDLSAGRGGIKAARAVFRAVLLESLPDLTDVEAGRLLQAVGAEEGTRVIQAAFDQLKAGTVATPVELPNCSPTGQLAFEAGGSRYVLNFGFNAQAELEDVFPGLDMVGIARLLGLGASIAQIRAMFRAALMDQREVSLHEAGGIMDRVGLATASAATAKAFIGSFPKVAEGSDPDQGEAKAPGNRQVRRATVAKAGGASPKPRRPRGTGKP